MTMNNCLYSSDADSDEQAYDSKLVSELPLLLASSPTTVALPLPNDSPSVETLLLPKAVTAVIKTTTKSWKTVNVSDKAKRTTNPIRAIVDPILAQRQQSLINGVNESKPFISLALGDPTAWNTLSPPESALASIRNIVEQSLSSSSPSLTSTASYVGACGTFAARQAIADFHTYTPYAPDLPTNAIIDADDVIIASGCSGALELALTALLNGSNNPNDNERDILLAPQPGFPLYKVIAESHGAQVVNYRLLPNQHWQCDLQHLAGLVEMYGSRIKALLVNNPGNPTGAVFSLDHLRNIISFCDEHCIPIISDEVYGNLVYNDNDDNNNSIIDPQGTTTFYPLAQVAASMGYEVPVITASGLGKQFLVPGWRLGWLVVQDNVYNSLSEIKAGIQRLAQVILGASHLVQATVPCILADTPENRAWKQNLRTTLQSQAQTLCNAVSKAPGLTIHIPSGAMYTMVTFDVDKFDSSINNDLDFCRELLKEENLFVLPGSCFGMSNAFRPVFCAPEAILIEAATRLQSFCQRHYVDYH